MKRSILIAGGSGLVGSRLLKMLDLEKYDLYVLSRSRRSHDRATFLYWDPLKELIELGDLKPDIVINLAGAGIADKKWSETRKKEIVDSRVKSAEFFAKLIAEKQIQPEIYLSASAVGIYGDRNDEVLTESSAEGDMDSFLVNSCMAWEKSAVKLETLVDRLIISRIGIVLSDNGGALSKMLLPLKAGIAGYFGNGKQFLPWIHIDDLCSAMIYLIENEGAEGIYNAVNPNPARVVGFTKALKDVFQPWAVLISTPSFVAKAIMGEMSEILLNSTRVIPQRLMESGFRFKYDELNSALEAIRAKDG